MSFVIDCLTKFDQSASVKLFLAFTPVNTDAIEEVITIFFMPFRSAASNTV